MNDEIIQVIDDINYFPFWEKDKMVEYVNKKAENDFIPFIDTMLYGLFYQVIVYKHIVRTRETYTAWEESNVH